MRRVSRLVRVVKISSLVILLVLISAIAFIKFDTAAAAQFTDSVLRPVFGARRVIGLEKIFFNLEDQAKQKTLDQSKLQAPVFTDQASLQPGTAGGGRLELASIPINNGFVGLKNEGVWQNRPLAAFPGQEVMAETFTRPDPARAFAIVTLVQIDSSKIVLGSVAGKKEPAGIVGKPGPGVVPKEIINAGRLIAAFDGGFQYRDGQYGMIVGNTVYLPLKDDVGTLVGYTDGSLKIVNYTGQDLGKNVAFVRQNCPILIDNGTMAVTDPKNKDLWGRTLTADIYTWRSGLGLTKNGDLLFAVGNNLTPATLATALRSAGAVSAIQLDINPSWVRFNVFESIGNGQYRSQPLTRDLKDGSAQYLGGYSKDFFYLYRK